MELVNVEACLILVHDVKVIIDVVSSSNRPENGQKEANSRNDGSSRKIVRSWNRRTVRSLNLGSKSLQGLVVKVPNTECGPLK